jgi:hypothetical protein
VRSLAVFGGRLIAGGYFTRAGDATANCVAAWDGEEWTALGSGVTGLPGLTCVYALEPHEGILCAGGRFTGAGGVDAQNVARWDGNAWSPVDGGIDGPVLNLLSHEDVLIAGGIFDEAGGVPADYVACWNGASWNPLGAGVDFMVVALEEYHGDVIAAGATDYFLGARPASRTIARWDGRRWNDMGSGIGGDVYALTVWEESAHSSVKSRWGLLVGGFLTSAGGNLSFHLALWNDVAEWDDFTWEDEEDYRLHERAGARGLLGVDSDHRADAGLRVEGSAGLRAWIERVTPVPIRESAALSYCLTETGPVRLVLHDATGRVIATPFRGWRQEGRHSVSWNLGSVASGVHFLRLYVDGTPAQTRKIVVQR